MGDNVHTSAHQSSIILLLGFPGVGKLAIARALNTHLTLSNHPTRLIDNHLLIDLAQAIVPRAHNEPSHKHLRSEIRRVAFTALRQQIAQTPGLTVIMTDCLADNEEDSKVLEEYVQIARTTGAAMYIVGVTCGAEEHGRRFGDEGRYREGKGKLDDVRVLEGLMEREMLVGREGVERMGKGCKVRYVELDTTLLTAEESASKILTEVGAWDGRAGRLMTGEA